MNEQQAQAFIKALGQINNGISVSDLPKYHGRQDEKSFMDVIEEINAIFNLHGITKDVDRAAKLMAVMRGPALKTFQDVYNSWTTQRTAEKNEERKPSYDVLVTNLAIQFRAPGTANTFRHRFSTRRKLPTESIEEFAKQLEKLALQAYTAADGFTDPLREKILVPQFIQGLPIEIRTHLLRCANISTMKEAVAKALLEEDIQIEVNPISTDALIAALNGNNDSDDGNGDCDDGDCDDSDDGDCDDIDDGDCDDIDDGDYDDSDDDDYDDSDDDDYDDSDNNNSDDINSDDNNSDGGSNTGHSNKTWNEVNSLLMIAMIFGLINITSAGTAIAAPLPGHLEADVMLFSTYKLCTSPFINTSDNKCMKTTGAVLFLKVSEEKANQSAYAFHWKTPAETLKQQTVTSQPDMDFIFGNQHYTTTSTNVPILN